MEKKLKVFTNENSHPFDQLYYYDKIKIRNLTQHNTIQYIMDKTKHSNIKRNPIPMNEWMNDLSYYEKNRYND